jgi:hypothetical protein
MQNLNKTQQKQYNHLLTLLNRIPKSEQQLQSKCAELLYYFYPEHWKRLVCVHNNSIRANTQGFGIVPGASDMYFLMPGGKTIYIEFKYIEIVNGKVIKSGSPSKAQLEWQALCVDLGHDYRLCYDEPNFWQIIQFNKPNEADIAKLKWFV